MEKHWRSVVNRSVCDYFFEAQSKASSPADVPPVIPTPHYYLISIFRNNIYFVSVAQSEGLWSSSFRDVGKVGVALRGVLLLLPLVPPLFVIEFLHRIVDIFKEYFSECTEQRIKDNYVIVYEVNPL